MKVGAGTRLQSGIPSSPLLPGRKANGLLLPGVVTATYVTDSIGHPYVEYSNAKPLAVYCDVLIYSNMGGQRWFGLKNVVVSQNKAGLHKGEIWKPRPATLDWVDKLDVQGGSNPAHIDGDHVLVGFMNNSLSQPVILKGLPHPSTDLGRDERDLGQRMKLVEADGDPDFFRHHGVHWGVDDLGNFLVDSTFANDGKLDDAGKEAAPPTDGKGTQTHKLPKDAKFEAVFYDMSNPASPSEVFRVSFQKDKAAVTMAGKATKAVAVANFLEIWDLAHTHPDGMGGTGPPAQAWDPNINSDKLTIPEN